MELILKEETTRDNVLIGCYSGDGFNEDFKEALPLKEALEAISKKYPWTKNVDFDIHQYTSTRGYGIDFSSKITKKMDSLKKRVLKAVEGCTNEKLKIKILLKFYISTMLSELYYTPMMLRYGEKCPPVEHIAIGSEEMKDAAKGYCSVDLEDEILKAISLEERPLDVALGALLMLSGLEPVTDDFTRYSSWNEKCKKDEEMEFKIKESGREISLSLDMKENIFMTNLYNIGIDDCYSLLMGTLLAIKSVADYKARKEKSARIYYRLNTQLRGVSKIALSSAVIHLLSQC